ncbi:MAG: Wzy polymerase domain-containing protein [Rhodoferax sp.]|uniref:PglL family O-oligosaccharyltransferase n=1 Tax=Rhodoferax sp. TaxID=50421 RepID=UPI002ACEDAC2|nr:Wzy polymerase domain-containing protein [Rhodoferax sp.]MDZ7890763.1 Wzy polymerase domain-containing protein [Rhodoferax sp.]
MAGTVLSDLRLVLVGSLWSFAWLYPFADGPIRDLKNSALFLIATYSALLIVGLRHLPNRYWILAAFALVVWINNSPNPYFEFKLIGVLGILVFLTAISFGLELRESPKMLQTFLIAVLLASAINAIQGILQWLGLADELYKWMVVPEQRGTAFGTFRQRNLYATFISVGLIATFWLHHLKKLSTAMSWMVVCLFTMSIAASSSRTGLLQVIAISVFGLIWRSMRSKQLTCLMIGQFLVLIMWYCFLPLVAEMHGVNADSGLLRVAQATEDTRLLIWADSINLISQRPWLGWGWKELNYAYFVSNFDPRYQGLIDHAHNLALHLAVEFGVLVAALLISMCLWLLFTFYRKVADLKPLNEKLTHVQGEQFSFVILILIVGIHSFLEFPLWHYGFLFLTGSFIGFLSKTPSLKAIDYRFLSIDRFISVISVCSMIVIPIVALYQYERLKLAYSVSFFDEVAVRNAKITREIEYAQESWLYRSYWEFLQLRSFAIDIVNASEVKVLAQKQLHFSSGPEVVIPLMRSMWLLNERNELIRYADRFCQINSSYKEIWFTSNAGDSMVEFLRRHAKKCSQIGNE